MKNLLLRWLLLSLLWTASAQADIRFERFIPTQPTSDSAPTAELWFSGSYGLVTCDYVGSFATLTADSVTICGNVVRLQIPVSRRQGPCVIFVPQPGDLPHRQQYPLLRLPEGSYKLEIVGRPVFSTDPLFSIATVPLAIGGGSLVQVPALTGWALAILMLTFIAVAVPRIRLKTLKTFSLLSLFAGSSQALPPPPVVTETFTIEITLRAGANRIRADTLVGNGLNGRLFPALADPVLSNLRLAQSKRPTGAYQVWLNARPNAPAAVLTRTAFAVVNC